MEASFWHQRWESNEIAFHESAVNPLLVKFFDELGLAKGSRVFLPLCGKTLDISWLLARGYRVAGAELSELAVQQLFQQLGIEPIVTSTGKLKRYSEQGIDIFVGDIFDLSAEILAAVDAVYDRAALVALPATMRERYATHLSEITACAPQLLICYEYDQAALQGPPFSIANDEVKRHYGGRYELIQLASVAVSGGLKGQCMANENVWLLKNKPV